MWLIFVFETKIVVLEKKYFFGMLKQLRHAIQLSWAWDQLGAHVVWCRSSIPFSYFWSAWFSLRIRRPRVSLVGLGSSGSSLYFAFDLVKLKVTSRNKPAGPSVSNEIRNLLYLTGYILKPFYELPVPTGYQYINLYFLWYKNKKIILPFSQSKDKLL